MWRPQAEAQRFAGLNACTLTRHRHERSMAVRLAARSSPLGWITGDCQTVDTHFAQGTCPARTSYHLTTVAPNACRAERKDVRSGPERAQDIGPRPGEEVRTLRHVPTPPARRATQPHSRGPGPAVSALRSQLGCRSTQMSASRGDLCLHPPPSVSRARLATASLWCGNAPRV